VLEEGTLVGVSGAIVLLLSEDGVQQGATLTGAEGRFELPAPHPGTYRIRVERIGHRSAESESFELGVGESVVRNMTAPVEAIRLAAISVTVDHQCVVMPEVGLQVARVWEEARKALVAAWVGHENSWFRYDLKGYERYFYPDSRVIRQERAWTETDVIRKRPYISRPLDELASKGYADIRPQHVRYYGPDEATLLSNVFLDSHCFRIADTSGDPRLLGLEFEPIDRGNRVEIEGVLWVDRETAELRHLEYRYVGLPWHSARGEAEGRIEYRRLPSGAWIVDQWWIRAPLFAQNVGRGKLRGFKEVGGEVAEVDEVRTGEESTRVQT
jgi:hypothetical protein